MQEPSSSDISNAGVIHGDKLTTHSNDNSQALPIIHNAASHYAIYINIGFEWKFKCFESSALSLATPVFLSSHYTAPRLNLNDTILFRVSPSAPHPPPPPAANSRNAIWNNLVHTIILSLPRSDPLHKM